MKQNGLSASESDDGLLELAASGHVRAAHWRHRANTWRGLTCLITAML